MSADDLKVAPKIRNKYKKKNEREQKVLSKTLRRVLGK
jgi:hypothetical protein